MTRLKQIRGRMHIGKTDSNSPKLWREGPWRQELIKTHPSKKYPWHGTESRPYASPRLSCPKRVICHFETKHRWHISLYPFVDSFTRAYDLSPWLKDGLGDLVTGHVHVAFYPPKILERRSRQLRKKWAWKTIKNFNKQLPTLNGLSNFPFD